MVKSGLVNSVTVSHYRLSVTFVNCIYNYFYYFLDYYQTKENKLLKFFLNSSQKLYFLFFIFYYLFANFNGAFVSGLDAGKLYQTWPLMNTTYFPND